jgi:hypothetical protein
MQKEQPLRAARETSKKRRRPFVVIEVISRVNPIAEEHERISERFMFFSEEGVIG